MNALESALAEFTARLERAGVRYMVIGGFANLYWGRPRLTQDLDVTVSVADDRLDSLLSALAPEFIARVGNPVAFAQATSLVPLESRSHIPIDMVIARLALEHQAIERAVALEVGGVRVRFATAEDLILHKIVSERPRDREDIEGIVRRQRGNLDLNYLRPRVALLAAALERPSIVSELERWIG